MRISDWSSDVCSSDLRRHPAVDRQRLEAWLKEMARRWRMSTLLNQVCIVDRFLDHLAEIGLIADNPIVALRRRYNVKHSKPIWRALASRSEEHTSELQSLMRISYAVFCLKKKKPKNTQKT